MRGVKYVTKPGVSDRDLKRWTWSPKLKKLTRELRTHQPNVTHERLSNRKLIRLQHSMYAS